MYTDHNGFANDPAGVMSSSTKAIPCECRAVYIGEMACITEVHTKEHQRYIRFYNLQHLAVTEHSIHQGHGIEFDNTMALAKLPHYISRVNCEAIKISIHDNFNSEEGYQLSPACKNIIPTLKEQRGRHRHTETMNHSSWPVIAAQTSESLLPSPPPILSFCYK